MPSRWTIRVHAGAVRDLYSVPRGEASDVTAAIDGLLRTPVPEEAEPVEGLPDIYRLVVGQRIVEYQVVDTEQAIRILNVA